MKVICDNCRAVYKIPDEKLVKPVNKATCRKCGHRMLIPRPREGASPDEKTLVTAVPPTPSPAPPREIHERNTSPLEDDHDNTLPGVPSNPDIVQRSFEDVPLFPATPMPAPTSAGPQYIAPSFTPPPPARTSTPVPSQDPRAIAPDGEGRNLLPPGTPRPPGARGLTPPAPPLRQAHDPAADMTFAIVAGLGSLLGALVLVGAVAVASGPITTSTRLLLAVGTLLTVGGGLSNLLVILTGGRGRRPARPYVAVITGVALAVVATAGGVGALQARVWLGGATADELVVAAGTPPADELPVALPSVDDAHVEPVDDTDAQVAVAVAEEEVAAGGPGPEPQKFEANPLSTSGSGAADIVGSTGSRSASRSPGTRELSEAEVEDLASRTSSSRTSSSSSSTVSTASTGTASVSSSPTATSSTASSLPASVSDQVIDTILRNNVELKRCFYNHKKATGSLPARVTVSFLLQPSGQVSEAGVSDEEFVGTELDGCLSRTIRAISMPPSSGSARRVKYPFQLQ